MTMLTMNTNNISISMGMLTIFTIFIMTTLTIL